MEGLRKDIYYEYIRIGVSLINNSLGVIFRVDIWEYIYTVFERYYVHDNQINIFFTLIRLIKQEARK